MEAGSLAPWLGVLIASSGAVTILAHVLQPPRRALIFIFKPLTTVLILAAALLPGTFRSSGEARAIVVGLLFSLAGDIWLLRPERYFAQGLAAFLAAHLSYAFAFRSGFAAHGFFWALGALALVGVITLRYLWPGIPSAHRVPVIIYVAAILGMAALALGRLMIKASPGTLAGAAGGLLFVVSDGALSVNRFRKPFRLAELLVLACYYAAQVLIAFTAW